MNKFSYAWEKFDAARRHLMLPHPYGETLSIAHAFHECSLGLGDVHESELDDTALQLLNTIKFLMDTSNIKTFNKEEGAWAAKAATFTTDQKLELSTAIDELCYWFRIHAKEVSHG